MGQEARQHRFTLLELLLGGLIMIKDKIEEIVVHGHTITFNWDKRLVIKMPDVGIQEVIRICQYLISEGFVNPEIYY